MNKNSLYLLLFVLSTLSLKGQELNTQIKQLVERQLIEKENSDFETTGDISLVLDETEIPLENDLDTVDYSSPIQDFYRQRGYKAVWYSEGSFLAKGDSFLQVLENADFFALSPEYYEYDTLVQHYDSLNNYKLEMYLTDPADLALFDVMLTERALQFATDMQYGRIASEKLPTHWEIPADDEVPNQLLEAIIESPTVKDGVDCVQPENEQYLALMAKYREFKELAKADTISWTIASDKKIELGDSSKSVLSIRNRLTALYPQLSEDIFLGKNKNNLTAQDTASLMVFDSTLVNYMKKYQLAYGLEPDGVAGPNTIKTMSKPLAEWIPTIEINLDRWRQLPANLGGQHIIVNIAGYYLDVFEGNTSGLHKQVMVGTVRNSTPVFSDILQYIEVNPYWTVPYSISTREILPKVKRDPGYLSRNNYEVLSGGSAIDPSFIDWSSVGRAGFPYVFRQKPGIKNALGTVKFMFPNQNNIYLHDTPSKRLFAETYRAFSHGCVRLENPMELAYYLFKDDPEWGPEALDNALNLRKNKRIYLKQSIPIFLMYFTATVNQQNELQFYPDVYKIDPLFLAEWADK